MTHAHVDPGSPRGARPAHTAGGPGRDGRTDRSAYAMAPAARHAPGPPPETGGSRRGATVGAVTKFPKFAEYTANRLGYQVDTILLNIQRTAWDTKFAECTANRGQCCHYTSSPSA